MLFTSLLVIANDKDKPECIFFLIFKDSIKKKMLTYENKMNMSSNYTLLKRKSLVSMVTYIFDHYGERAIRKCDIDIMSQFLVMTLSFLSFRCCIKCLRCN